MRQETRKVQQCRLDGVLTRQFNFGSLVDQGCWISYDRVNAFLSLDGVKEIGYHGRQPVSKNSRVLVSQHAVLSFEYRPKGETGKALRFDQVEWSPSNVITESIDGPSIRMTTKHRSLGIQVRNTAHKDIEFVIHFHRASCHAEIHGERFWSQPVVHGSEITMHFRDRIILHDWLKRTGPYAGDFLIPEPWRRVLFVRPIVSGNATIDDVKSEYRESLVPLYDVTTYMKLGGSHYRPKVLDDVISFSSSIEPSDTVEFHVAFSDTEANSHIGIVTEHERMQSDRDAPQLTLEGFSHIERFFSNVPDLIDSCRVTDLGMTRASAGAYYWIWAWDNIITAMEYPRWSALGPMEQTVEFLNAHRDVNGLIPMRWTRDLLPLDTPARGGLESLFGILVHNLLLNGGSRQYILSAYPFLVTHLDETTNMTDEYGRFRSLGFYPDLPLRLGRTENSAVAMECALQYAFCRALSKVAMEIGDDAVSERSRIAAARIHRFFLENFWSQQYGFVCDSIDVVTNQQLESFPLYSFAFLLLPEAIDLLQDRVADIANVIERNHLTPNGIRTVPSWDRNAHTESVMSAWYPCWDFAAVKFLRQAGRSEAIMHWMNSVEETLQHFGYCPEFLSMDNFDASDIGSWKRHGAASNLNCVTGWFRALIEGLTGVEFHANGLTVMPCKLPINELELNGIHHLQTVWRITVINGEGETCRLEIDGEQLQALDVSRRYFDGNARHLTIRYGS